MRLEDCRSRADFDRWRDEQMRLLALDSFRDDSENWVKWMAVSLERRCFPDEDRPLMIADLRFKSARLNWRRWQGLDVLEAQTMESLRSYFDA